MKILKILSLVVVVLVLVVGATFFLIPHERILNQALERIENTTGRKIQVQGGSRITVFPNLGVQARDVIVSEAKDGLPFGEVTAKELNISVKTLPLISGNIELNRLLLDGADITLLQAAAVRDTSEADQDNQASDKVNEADDNHDDQKEILDGISFEAVELKDALVRYQTGAQEKTYTLNDVNALLVPIAETDGLKFNLNAKYLQMNFDLRVGVPSLSALMAKKGSADILFKSPIARIALLAKQPLGMERDIELDATVNDIAGLLTVLEQSSQNWPASLGNSFSLKADAHVTDSVVEAKSVEFDFAKNSVRGALRLGFSDGLRLSGALDLGAFSWPEGRETSAQNSAGSNTANAATSGWSTDPVSIPKLDFITADLTITAQSLTYGPYRGSAIQAAVLLKNSILTANIAQLSTFGGDIAGNVILDTRKSLGVDGNIVATGLNANDLVRTFSDTNLIEGELNLTSNFSASGNSMAALMGSLGGKGQLSIDQGRYTGIDLDKILRSGDLKTGTTLFDRASASYSMLKGVLTNDDFLLSLPDGEVRGAGTVNIGDRSLDYLVTPKSLKAGNFKGFAVPVLLKGSWDNIQILPDLEAAVEKNLEKELKAAEEKIKKDVKDRINKETEKAKKDAAKKLGVDVENTKSIEDALKMKAKDELAKGLKNLLGK
ncbi:MAG: AsmA family protein [Rhodobacteraceae bacterium]|nr:AsmA family protein [Paracoccaceae bacterium]